MREIIIDAGEMKSEAAAQELLAKKLGFPEYYGGNLDALHDCLTDITEETRVVFVGCGAAREALGEYFDKIRRVFADSSAETPTLSIKFEEEPISQNPFLAEQNIPPEEREKIIDAFFSSLEPPVLKRWSPKRRKKLVILDVAAGVFERGRIYNEREVNALLTPVYEDIFLLRRELIDYGFMKRTPSGSEYKRL